jgi:hypothetical protein
MLECIESFKQRAETMDFKNIAVLLCALLAIASTGAQAGDDWKFGIGTGISSFALDGDIGFATPATAGPGLIFEVDLDNGDTADMFESALGVSGFAAKGPWKILYQVGSVTLEDDDNGLDAEWDRVQAEIVGIYQFAETGKHSWGVLFGVRYSEHEWDFSGVVEADAKDDWTDAIFGITHAVPLGSGFAWANRVSAGIGDSESSTFVSSSVNWTASERFLLNLTLSYRQEEFGDEDDIADDDFYYYDMEEPAIAVGFMYTW